MLDCIREWESPRETIDGREYVYLIEHEAFDWLLLAERICDSVPPGLLPLHEVEALLVDESPPVPLSEVEFQERLGTAKYWAHLNFLYGVRVEQALHLAMERILQKERSGLSFSHARDELDGDVFGRIYGARQRDLLREYRRRGKSSRCRPGAHRTLRVAGVHLLAVPSSAGASGSCAGRVGYRGRAWRCSTSWKRRSNADSDAALRNPSVLLMSRT